MANYMAFEGIEAVGKSTLISMLKRDFHNVYYTSEPKGNLEDTAYIYDLLKKSKTIDPLSRLFLILANRREILTKEVIPNLVNNISVITDRSLYTCMAYQGYSEGLGLDLVYDLSLKSCNEVLPDIVFFIDIPIETMVERKNISNRSKTDVLDNFPLDFYHKSREFFLKLCEADQSFIYIDGNRDIKEVYESVKHVVEKFL